MIKSKTELSLRQLKQEIDSIVKNESQNDTSYFPNILMLVSSFDNYLQCLNHCVGDNCDVQNKLQCHTDNPQVPMFKQQISLQSLLIHKRFVCQLLEWDFAFSQQFRQLFVLDSVQHKQKQKLFPHVNLVEVILLMYLGLQVERKEIVGRRGRGDSGMRDLGVMKEVVKMLEEGCQRWNGGGCGAANGGEQVFSINEDKFVKILMMKSFKLKLHKQNFSFGPANQYQQSQQQLQNHPVINTVLSRNEMQQNFSLISIKSEYKQSVVIEEEIMRMKGQLGLGLKMQLNRNSGNYLLQRSNLSSDDIFQGISMNELCGYISQ